MTTFNQRLSLELAHLGAAKRALPTVPRGLVNLSSNDYLGLLEEHELRAAFYDQLSDDQRLLSVASSRLLTGNCPAVQQFETHLAEAYQAESALVFGSGYHANTGILPALAGKDSLVIADKLIHASMIDGIRMAGCKFFRYRHNDLADARRLLERHAATASEVFLMTESIFSMDGDKTDLQALVALKKDFPNLIIYLDEAHGVGVFGEHGLGCAEEAHCIKDIDLLVGTLGKAFSSTGAFLISSTLVRETLINKMRPFIFTTALPPINLAWSDFVLQHMPQFAARRKRLLEMGHQLTQAIQEKGVPCISESHIVPYLIGENEAAILAAKTFRDNGFYVLPIRPPTVPAGTARLRFSLTAQLPESDFQALLALIKA